MKTTETHPADVQFAEKAAKEWTISKLKTGGVLALGEDTVFAAHLRAKGWNLEEAVKAVAQRRCNRGVRSDWYYSTKAAFTGELNLNPKLNRE